VIQDNPGRKIFDSWEHKEEDTHKDSSGWEVRQLANKHVRVQRIDGGVEGVGVLPLTLPLVP